MAGALQCTTDTQQLFFGRSGSGHQFTVNGFMEDRPRRGEPDGSGLKPLLHNCRHPGDLCLRGRFVGRTAITHDVGTHCSVGHLCGDIDRTIQLFQCVEIFGERLPVPSHTLGERAPRDVFNAFHQTDQPLLLVRRCRSKADATVAHHDRRNAMPR